MLSLGIFLLIFIISSPIGMSIWFIHALISIFTLTQVSKLSQYYLIWFLLLITYFFAANSRLSLEYLLISSACLIFGASKFWLDLDTRKRFRILLVVFIVLGICDFFKFSLSELGSLLMWVPVFLVIYLRDDDSLIPKLKRKFLGVRLGTFVYLSFLVMLFFLNKKITFLAQVLSFRVYLRSRLIYISAFILVGLSFIFKEKLIHFIEKSIQPRLLIWQGAFEGFLQKPLFGHGFGTFVLDFPVHRHLEQVLGAHGNEQVNHGHNLFIHYAFELGLVGLILVIALFYLVAVKAPQALPCLALIGVADSNLQSFNQFLLMGLIIMPLCYLPKADDLFFENIFKKLPSSLRRPAQISFLALSLMILVPSIIGHYYYDQGDLNRAINTDAKHPLYFLMRGVKTIESDLSNSEKDLLKAVELAPAVPYIRGALAAAQLSNMHLREARESVDFALKHTGNDAYWFLISSLIYQNQDSQQAKAHYLKALEIDPHLETFLSDPSLPSYKVIGGKEGDSRIKAFYRSGGKLYLPLPYVEILPKQP
ncbi:MAG: O-antigen ligase family protein [bacterium]